MDDLVSVSQQDCLLGTLPLLDVNQVRALSYRCCLSRWSILLRKIEFKRLKLLIAVKVALEVLEEHHFLVDRFWIFEEIKAANLVNEAFHGLSIAILDRLLLTALYVVKVEHIRV